MLIMGMEECVSQKKVTEDVPWVRHGESGCPVDTTLRLIGGKWKPRIVHLLRSGPQRYTEVRRHLTGISSQVLTVVLRELERDGIVSRAVFAEVPPRTEYRLTELGETLGPVMEAMCRWGQAYSEGRLPR